MSKQPTSTTTKVVAWVGILSALVVSVITPLSQLEYPEWWSSETDKTMIEHEIHEQLIAFPTTMHEKYTEDSIKFDSRLRFASSQITNLKAEVKNLQEIVNANQKQTEFNSLALSITNEALVEEMDKKENGCNYTYYETNGKDNWNIFEDYYDMRVLYSIDLRSDCRVYYTPIFRSKIKIQ